MCEAPKRKPVRLTEYDYSAPGAYFVTICTHEKRCILSEITVGEGLAPPVCRLTDTGRVVENEILSVPVRYPGIGIDKYVIMPNHIHMIVEIRAQAGGASPSPTLFDAVRVIKSLSTRRSGLKKLWQRSYYEHVIRGERDYAEIWTYIDENPAKWTLDRYYET